MTPKPKRPKRPMIAVAFPPEQAELVRWTQRYAASRGMTAGSMIRRLLIELRARYPDPSAAAMSPTARNHSTKDAKP